LAIRWPEAARRAGRAPRAAAMEGQGLAGFAAWGCEVAPRLLCSGVGVSLITIDRTVPQVVNTSGGLLKLQPTLGARAQMCVRFMPKQTVLKTSQFGALREVKLALDQYFHPSVSTMLAYGTTGTLFQSIIYNTLISDTYKFMTGAAARKTSVSEVCRGLMPGFAWCFIRECCATGGGLYFGPMLKAQLSTSLRERGHEVPELPLRFGSGLAAGAVCALGTQWLHNAALTAGRLAALSEPREAPHYTLLSLRRAYAEQGRRIFYLNFPQRMVVIGVASALLNLVEIFHQPGLRLM